MVLVGIIFHNVKEIVKLQKKGVAPNHLLNIFSLLM